MASIVPAQTGLSRVFLIEGRAAPGNSVDYQSFMRAGAVSQSFGDVEKIEVPSPSGFNEFVEVGSVQGAEERVEFSLEGRYAVDLKSTMLRLARQGCPIDIQVNLGICRNPTVATDFDKKVILEDVRPTNYETEDLGTLSSDDRAAVNETLEVSARQVYEVTGPTFSQRSPAELTNEILDAIIADQVACGDCDEQSNGCEKVFLITSAAGGSPGTPADVLYSLDGGVTWYAHDIDSMNSTDNPTGIAQVGSYLVVTSNAQGGHNYALKSEFKEGIGDPSFTAVTTGYVAGGEPNDIWSVGSTAFVVGDGGYVYQLSDATAAVTVLDAGQATVDDLNAVHANSTDLAVAAGNNGAVIYTLNGASWQSVTLRPVGAGIHLNAVWAKAEKEWWVGTNDGRLFYTLDQGESWTEKTFSGSGSGVVRDIAFANDTVVYVSHDTTAPLGRLLVSYDGGNSFSILPLTSASLPANDRMTAIAACQADADFIVGAGLADDATDGFIVVGEGKNA